MLIMLRKHFLIVAILILTCINLQAQSFEEWIRRVNEQTKNSDHVEVKVDVRAFNKADESLFYNTSIALKRKGKMFYYRMEEIEVVYDARYQITANHGFKTISLFEVGANAPVGPPEIMSLDSILSYYTNPRLISENDSQVKYRVSQISSMVGEIFITINKKERQIHKIEYDYAEGEMNESNVGNRVELRFHSKPLSDADSRYFDINKYVRIGKEKDNVQLTEAYKGYYLEKLN